MALISTVGLLNGLGWALFQNWRWASGLWPDAHFNWWRCWESCGGISIGAAYGVAYYLVNRRASESITSAAWFAWMMKQNAFFYIGAGDLMKSILTGKAEDIETISRKPAIAMRLPCSLIQAGTASRRRMSQHSLGLAPYPTTSPRQAT